MDSESGSSDPPPKWTTARFERTEASLARPGTSAEARAPPPFAAAGDATPNAPPVAVSVFGVVVRARATGFGVSRLPRFRNATESEPACALVEASGMLTPFDLRYARMSGIVA